MSRGLEVKLDRSLPSGGAGYTPVAAESADHHAFHDTPPFWETSVGWRATGKLHTEDADEALDAMLGGPDDSSIRPRCNRSVTGGHEIGPSGKPRGRKSFCYTSAGGGT